MAQTEPLLNANSNEKYARLDSDSPAGAVSPIDQPRHCRDVCWAVSFMVFWAGSLLIMTHAIHTGDLKRLSYGIDTNGNVCGTRTGDQQVEGKWRADTYGRPVAFLPFPEHSDLVFCVDKCAKSSAWSADSPGAQFVCFEHWMGNGTSDCALASPELRAQDPAAFNKVAALCYAKYGYSKFPTSFRRSDSSEANGGFLNRAYKGRCFPMYVAKEYMHFCVPSLPSKNETCNATSKPTAAAARLQATRGVASCAIASSFEKYFAAAGSVFGRMVYELQANTWLILGSLVMAAVLSLIWISALPYVGPCLIWGSLAITVTALASVSYFLLRTSWKGGDAVFSYQGQLTFGMGVVAGALALIVVCLACCMASRIQLALSLSSHAGRAMIDVPSMLITPVACFTVFLGLVYYWVYVAAYLVSSGTLVLHGEPVTSNSTSISSSWTSSHIRSFTYDQHTRWMLIYHAFALLWNAAFLLDFGKLVVSSCVAIWYWAPNPLDSGRNWLPPLERMRTPALGADSKRAIDFNVFLQSVDTSLRFHIGSVAVGSFLQAACFAIRIAFEYARQQMADKSGRRPNCIARMVLCCVSCCLSCVESFIEFVSDNAYIQIAMFGGNFCQSASAGFRLLMRNPARMVVTGLVQSVLVFAGKVVVVTACAIFGVCMMYREHAADVATRTETVYAAAAYSLLPLCLVVFGAWLVCSVVFNIFVVAIQTMLQCVCEDEERNDGNQHPFFMSQELRHVLDNIDSNN